MIDYLKRVQVQSKGLYQIVNLSNMIIGLALDGGLDIFNAYKKLYTMLIDAYYTLLSCRIMLFFKEYNKCSLYSNASAVTIFETYIQRKQERCAMYRCLGRPGPGLDFRPDICLLLSTSSVERKTWTVERGSTSKKKKSLPDFLCI